MLIFVSARNVAAILDVVLRRSLVSEPGVVGGFDRSKAIVTILQRAVIAFTKSSGSRQLPRETDGFQVVDQGYAMVSMLIVVVILGALVTIALAGPHGPTPSVTVDKGSPSTTAATAQSIAGVVSRAQVSACEADFTSVDTAIGEYRTLNSGSPSPGTAWATSTTSGGPFMQSWPSGAPNFSISWNGSQLSVVPKKGATSHGSYGTSSPATGCFAP
jgi:hypothetical protein